MKKAQKKRIYRKAQKIIQTMIGMIFISHFYLFLFLVKFEGLRKTAYLLVIAIITGLCLLGKLQNHYKANPRKCKQEIRDFFSSDYEIRF